MYPRIHFQKIEVGSIYVFKNRYHDNQDFEITATSENTNWKGNNGIYQLKREKASKGARFGMSLLRLGKFDGDNYEDFAVGAPYEDNGVGAVYIYRGSESFWRKDGVHGKNSFLNMNLRNLHAFQQNYTFFDLA